MRLGIGTHTYGWAVGVAGREPESPMTAPALIRKAVEFGVEVVQICDNLPLHALAASDRRALAAQARAVGIHIQVGTRGSRVEDLREYLALAQEFNSPLLRVVIDSTDDKPAPEEVVARIRALRPELEQSGVCLAIENHDRFSAATLVDMVQASACPQVGICLDTVNSFGALEGPEVVLEALLPYTVNLHVKDFVIHRHTHQMGFEIEGCPAGRGRLRIPQIIKRLRAANPRADAILELWTPPEATVAATIEKEATWAYQSITYLKQILEGES